MAIGRYFLCIALSGAFSALNPADPKPTIAISPRVALAPLAELRVTARIPRDPHNRAYCVVAALDDMVIRRSCEQMEGENAAMTNEFYWKNFNEGGEYTITLMVQDDAGHTYQTATTLTLKGINDGDKQP